MQYKAEDQYEGPDLRRILADSDAEYSTLCLIMNPDGSSKRKSFDY